MSAAVTESGRPFQAAVTGSAALFPVTAAILAAPRFVKRSPPPLPFVFCNGRHLCRRPFPLFPLGAAAPVGPRVAARPSLRPAFLVDIELPCR